MNEHNTEQKDILSKTQETEVTETTASDYATSESNGAGYTRTAVRPKLSKKKLAIIAVVVAAIAIAIAILTPSKLKRAIDEAMDMGFIGAVTINDGDSYTVMTIEDDVADKIAEGSESWIDYAEDYEARMLKGIRYVNRELGFGVNVYDMMINTDSSMPMQVAETDDYEVSWFVKEDTGALVVTWRGK